MFDIAEIRSVGVVVAGNLTTIVDTDEAELVARRRRTDAGDVALVVNEAALVACVTIDSDDLPFVVDSEGRGSGGVLWVKSGEGYPCRK